ncbi:MAG: ComF family protein [Polaribacter sp.]
MALLNDFFQLFYPKLCANCDAQLTQNEKVLCTFCRHDLPLINLQNYKENKISKIFYGRIAIENVVSLLYYRKKGSAKKLISELKYKGNEEIGVFFGNWLGELLLENNALSNVNCIVPVPLHPKKRRKRGYNQVTKFGETLGKHLKIPLKEDILIRVSSTNTQTLKSRLERFTNIDTKFLLKDTTIFKNKHVLLIDDVITTGATLEACAKELQKTSGIKISIVTMAFTE